MFSRAPLMALRRAAQGASRGSSTLMWASAATAVGAGGALLYLERNSAHANMEAEGLHPPSYPFPQKTLLGTFDHASIRRGFQVFKEVCAACHSLDLVHWRNLVDVAYTEEEVRAMAEEYEYRDGPDDKGEMFDRPGKLTDPIPRPYPNEEAARAANAGALPPDLSLITKARHGGVDYIYALLTGYSDPPPGVEVREGLNYNPYFPGGAIAMAQNIFDGVVEYEDGTPNTASQITKDVVTFLNWAAEPELDERKKMGLKAVLLFSMLTAVSLWVKRNRWQSLKTRKIAFAPPKAWDHKPTKKH
ncbi:cytochrome c1 [Coemansia javaensis]|uniref:quinol--cytochrome-c reductase n=1 Tax=Coemansia javaensis TaxID=2761396 RepID=A0A9W8HL54_9FUNG|nr:cytochrome c1 [Coemansia javaensis]